MHEIKCESTCELHGLVLLLGVEGIEESGNSVATIFPDKNSNSWILAEELNKLLDITLMIVKYNRVAKLIFHNQHE